MIRHSPGAALAATFLLLVVVALAPLPFGSVLVRERTLIQVVACLALVAALVAHRRRPSLGPAAAPALAIAAVGVYGLLQALPLPLPLARLLAPGVVASWQSTADVLGTEIARAPLSLAPGATFVTGLNWLAVAAGLMAAGLMGRERASRRVVGAVFVAVALFEVIYGADRWLSRSDEMWGLEVGGDPSRLRGTFINANHAAFYLMLAAAVVVAWMWWSLGHLRRRGSAEQRLLATALPVFAFVTIFAGAAFTGSRAGILALAGAITVQAALLALQQRRWQLGLWGAAVLVVGFATLASFSLRQGLGRWLETSVYEVTWNARLEVYAATWKLWLLAPVTGTGLGTFREAFPLVQPPDLARSWYHAHSDVLELLATTGVVGPPLVALAAFALGRRLWRVLGHGRRSEDRAAALAALGAVAGALLHSCVDFALTLPANAFTLAIVCGLAVGAEVEEPAPLRAGVEPEPERRGGTIHPHPAIHTRPRAEKRP